MYKKKELVASTIISEHESLIDITRFSTCNRLVITVTHVLEAVDYWKKTHCTPVKRRERAERLCFKLSQSNSFSEEIK